MEETVISFRYDPADIKAAATYADMNDLDISGYIVFALLHLLDAKVQQGELPCPEFLKRNPHRVYDSPAATED